jgi:chorismate mutase / prephenate dehydratase
LEYETGWDLTAEVVDPLVEGLREQITALDVEIVELVNRRLGLVSTLWTHKREHEQPLRSPEREEWLLRHLLASNSGPLSEAGVKRLQESLLDLTRSELA